MMTLLLAFLIGFCAGLRTFIAPAVTAWAIHWGWLRFARPLSISLYWVIFLSFLALVELVVDKLPATPNRTALVGVVARILSGGLTGACVAAAGGQLALAGVALGAAGALAGCFGGFHARQRAVKSLGVRDPYVAVIEDLIAVGGSLWVVSR